MRTGTVGPGSLARQSALLMTGRMLGFAIAFPLPLILVRVLSPDQFGLYKQLLLVQGTLSSIVTLGLGTSLFYFVPRNPDQRHVQVFHTMAALVVLGTLGAAGLILFKSRIALALNNPLIESYIPYLAALTIVGVPASVLETHMLVLKQVKLAAWVGVQFDLLRSAVMIAAALLTHNILVLVLAALFWSACRLTALLVHLRHVGVPFWIHPQWRLFREQFAYSVPFASASIAASVNENLHQYVVSYAFTPALFAVYSIGYLQIPLVSIAFDSISDVTLVRVTELNRDGRLGEAARVIAESATRVSLLLFPLYAWATVSAHDVIVLLYTTRFESSVPLFQIFLTLVPLTAISTAYVLRAFADTPFIFLGHLARLAIGAALLAALVPTVGLRGAALAIVLSVGAHQVIILLRVSRLLRVSPQRLLPWLRLAGVAVVSLLVAAVARLIAHAAVTSLAPRLLLSGVLFVMAYGPFALLVDRDRPRQVTAAFRTIKRWLKGRMPRLYSAVTWTLAQVVAEYQAIRRMGIRHFLPGRSGYGDRWQDALPVQTPRRVTVSGVEFETYRDLIAYLRQHGVEHAQGGHTIYLPPRAARSSVFREVLRDYPLEAGLKILKNQGGISNTHYVNTEALSARGESFIQYRLTHAHPHLSLVANLLYLEGIGPRLFDLLEIQCGSTLWTAYVVEHVDGREPSMRECEAGIEAIRQLEQRDLIRVILPLGFQDQEFECPGCSRNARATAAGDFKYIDFQNFRLLRYGPFLNGLVSQAAKASHFGQLSVLRGGRYLYQTVPGTRSSAKRDTRARMVVLGELMAAAGVSVADRLVLDFGCNIGIMMAEYLRLGAKWCHGWDRPEVVSHTEKVLLALGCTRFSTSGTDLRRSPEIEADIPSCLEGALSGCVISYLAVHGHVGWLRVLQRVPWSFLIYEGHEGQSLDDFRRYLDDLRLSVPVRVASQRTYSDGDCTERIVAILVREPAPVSISTVDDEASSRVG